MNHRKRPKPQEIHFQKPKLLQRGHGKLSGDGTVASPGQRHKRIRCLGTDHHPRGMHGAVPGQPLQAPAHVNQAPHLLVLFILLMKLRIPLQRLVDGDIQFPRNHPGNGIHKCIGQIHDTSHIPYHALCRQGTEGHNLHHLVASVFPAHIIDDFLPAVVTEIHIDIRHGHTLRIQETLKKQIVPDRLDIRNLQAVCHDAPCAGASARPYRNPVAPGVIDKIPHNQEVVHISHPANDGKFVVKSLAQRLSGIACGHTAVAVAFLQPVIAEFIQISPRVIALRHLISGQLGLPERNLHIAPVGNALGILQSLPRIGKQPLHLLLALHEILAALIAHPVLVRQLLVGLKAQQNIVGIRVPGIGVVDVIGGH